MYAAFPKSEILFKIWEDVVGSGVRFVGSPGEQRAAEYIFQSCRELGFEPLVQKFTQRSFSLKGTPQLEISQPTSRSLPCHIMLGSPPTDGRPTGGRLEYLGKQGVIGLLEWEKYAIENRDGKIVGFVVGRPDGPAMPQPLEPGALPLPHFAIGNRALEMIRDFRDSGEDIICSGSFPAVFSDAECKNLIVRIPGRVSGPPILVSAHYDCMYSTPGGNDNASGVVGLLGLARMFSGKAPHRDLLLVFFTAEEWGTAGSKFFVSEMAQGRFPHRIHSVINLDGIACGPRLQAWVTSEQTEIQLRDLIQHNHRELERPEFLYPAPPGSDHAPFAAAGIPAFFFTRGDKIHWHQVSDVPSRADTAGIDSVIRTVSFLVEELD